MGYAAKREIILNELGAALAGVREEDAERLTAAIMGAEQVFVVGVGRVLLMLQAFAKRLNHLGVRANFVGAIDEPAITENDLLLVGSGSGNSAVPVAIAKIARKHGARIFHIGSNPKSTLTEIEDDFLKIPTSTKLDLPEEIPSQQIMSSLFEQSLLLLLDAVAMMLAEQKGIEDLHVLWRFHANLE